MGIAKNLGSITTRMLVILTFAFLLIVLLAFWVIDIQGKPRLIEMTSESVEEAGNNVINSVMASINRVDGLAKATSAMSGALPKDEAIYIEVVGNLMHQTEANIGGGGIWFDPNKFKEGQDRQSFVWMRKGVGKNIQATERYNSETQTPNAYYRDWWYVPAMYANHDHCVWSRTYVDPTTKQPMMTCARALYNSHNKGFDGVVSFNLFLDNLDKVIARWQQKIKGYMFLVDLDNRFLTFPNKAQVMHTTAENPQGEMMTVAKFSETNAGFLPIATSLDALNQDLIDKAIAKDKNRYNLVAGSILSTTNLRKINKEESNLISALMLSQRVDSNTKVDTHLVDTVAVPNDTILKQAATAFVFQLPLTHWKMVIVKPDSDMVSVANALSDQLIRYMLFGFLPILLLTALAFRNYFTRPLAKMASVVGEMGQLIEQKKYQQLTNCKLPECNVSEIKIISNQTNELIDKIVENEGALAQINVHLEKKVVERTYELQKAMNDLKSSQVQLVRAEKMATLGQMVAGVAHEVNTPLGYVRSNIELVGENLGRFDELITHTEQLLTALKTPNISQHELDTIITETLECCDEIREDELSEDLAGLVKDSLFGVDQIAELVINLRDFSRIDESKVKNININDCIKSSLTISRNNLKTIEVITNLGELPKIQCNPSQINQVFLNLFNNAAQAIPTDKQGKLVISSKMLDANNIGISVKDNGYGIPEEKLDKIFEPFFTTKKAGDGTGLGLAISSQIIEQHGGVLQVKSIVGKGSQFLIILPINGGLKKAETKPKALFEG